MELKSFESNNINIRRINQQDLLYQQVLNLRNTILKQPLWRIDLFSQDRSSEINDIVIIAEKSSNADDRHMSKVIGCVMLQTYDKQTYKLRQMAIDVDERGKNIGKKLAQFAETIALQNGMRRIYITSRVTSIGFYEKMGYKIISEEFTEMGLNYVEMEKFLK